MYTINGVTVATYCVEEGLISRSRLARLGSGKIDHPRSDPNQSLFRAIETARALKSLKCRSSSLFLGDVVKNVDDSDDMGYYLRMEEVSNVTAQGVAGEFSIGSIGWD